MTALMATVRAELPAPVKALVDAERAFSAAATAKGQRDAFLEFLADDSLLFRPGPVPGKMFYRTRPVPPGILSWAPVFADVSADADLGVSTGPYEFRKDEKATDPPSGYGHFVSIWRKQKDGAWKVEVDLGTSHDKYPKAVAAITAAEVETLKAAPKPPAAKAETDLQQTLSDADKALAAAAAKDGLVKAYQAVALDDVRILRNGQLPVVGKKLLEKALGATPAGAAGATAPAAPTWEPVHTRVSTSGDLGYTTGAIGPASGGAAPMGGAAPQRQYYLHVWRRDASGAWKLLLDVVP
jgi:ketosteroid isomerase-like protein